MNPEADIRSDLQGAGDMTQCEIPNDARLKEYEVAARQKVSLDARVWNSGALLVGSSLVVMSWMAQRIIDPQALWTTQTRIFVSIPGGIVIALLVGFYLLFQKWTWLDRIETFRMKELEVDLGMRRILYTIKDDEFIALGLDTDARTDTRDEIRKAREVIKKPWPLRSATGTLNGILVLIITAAVILIAILWNA